MARMRTAKSCGPDTPTLVSSCAGFIRAAMVAKKPGHQGEREISRKTIAQGGPDASAEPVCSCAFLCTFLHARPRVQRAPGLPCALCFRGGNFWHSPGELRRGNAKVCLRFLGCLKFESVPAPSGIPPLPSGEV